MGVERLSRGLEAWRAVCRLSLRGLALNTPALRSFPLLRGNIRSARNCGTRFPQVPNSGVPRYLDLETPETCRRIFGSCILYMWILYLVSCTRGSWILGLVLVLVLDRVPHYPGLNVDEVECRCRGSRFQTPTTVAFGGPCPPGRCSAAQLDRVGPSRWHRA